MNSTSSQICCCFCNHAWVADMLNWLVYHIILYAWMYEFLYVCFVAYTYYIHHNSTSNIIQSVKQKQGLYKSLNLNKHRAQNSKVKTAHGIHKQASIPPQVYIKSSSASVTWLVSTITAIGDNKIYIFQTAWLINLACINVNWLRFAATNIDNSHFYVLHHALDGIPHTCYGQHLID